MRRETAAARPFDDSAIAVLGCGAGNSFLARGGTLWYAIRKFVFRCSEAKGGGFG